jgi:hypothetical protein
VADLGGPVVIGNVEGSQPPALVGGEDDPVAHEPFRPVLPDVVRPERRTDRKVVLVVGRREGGNRHGMMLRAQIQHEDPLLLLFACVLGRLVGDHREVAARKGQRRVGVAAERRMPVESGHERRRRGVVHVQEDEPCVAPRRVGVPVGHDAVVEGDPIRRCALLAACEPLSRKPEAADHLGSRDIRDVDHNEDMVAEAVEAGRGVHVAPASPPGPMEPEPLDVAEPHGPRRHGIGEVIEPQPTGVRDVLPPVHGMAAVDPSPSRRRRAREVVLLLRGQAEEVELLHHRQVALVSLDAERPGLLRARHEVRRDRSPRVAHVDDAEPVVEGMGDVGVPPSDHHLSPIGPPSLVATTKEGEPVGGLAHLMPQSSL